MSDNEKHTVVFYMRSGATLRFKSSTCKLTHDNNGDLTAYSITGIVGNVPMYLRIEDIVAVVQERET